jgi:hypothetical protein
VLDDRLAIVPVGLGALAGEGLAQPRRDARQLLVAALDRGGGHQRQRQHTIAMVEGQALGEGAAHRDADHVRASDVQRVEDRHRVGDEVGARVAGGAARVGRRAPGVAVVIAHDAAAGGGQLVAQLVVPPVHGRARAADEEDRGRVGRADRLDAELRAVVDGHGRGLRASHASDGTPALACTSGATRSRKSSSWRSSSASGQTKTRSAPARA